MVPAADGQMEIGGYTPRPRARLTRTLHKPLLFILSLMQLRDWILFARPPRAPVSLVYAYYCITPRSDRRAAEYYNEMWAQPGGRWPPRKTGLSRVVLRSREGRSRDPVDGISPRSYSWVSVLRYADDDIKRRAGQIETHLTTPFLLPFLFMRYTIVYYFCPRFFATLFWEIKIHYPCYFWILRDNDTVR